MTDFWLRDSLYRDTAPVPPTKILYRDSLPAPIKLVPPLLICKSGTGATRVMLNKICTRADSYRQAKSAPSRFFGKKAGTQPPIIAGSLGLINKNCGTFKNKFLLLKKIQVMTNDPKVKEIMKILIEWNPLGEMAKRIPDLDNYEPEANDIYYFFDDDLQFPRLKDKRKKTLLVVKTVINEALNLDLTDDNCIDASDKIYKILSNP